MATLIYGLNHLLAAVQNISGKFMLATLLKCVDDFDIDCFGICFATWRFRATQKSIKTPQTIRKESECVSMFAWEEGKELSVHTKFEY